MQLAVFWVAVLVVAAVLTRLRDELECYDSAAGGEGFVADCRGDGGVTPSEETP